MRGFAERLRPAHLQRLELPQRALEVAHSAAASACCSRSYWSALSQTPPLQRSASARRAPAMTSAFTSGCSAPNASAGRPGTVAGAAIPASPRAGGSPAASGACRDRPRSRAVRGRLRVLAPPARAQDALESVENIRDVVVELRSRERGARRRLGIGIRRRPARRRAAPLAGRRGSRPAAPARLGPFPLSTFPLRSRVAARTLLLDAPVDAVAPARRAARSFSAT